jgi:predicted RNA methylase
MRPLGNTRVTGKEQFYTPPATAAWVVDRVLRVVPDAVNATWLEPSAGTGAFLNALADRGITDVVAMDIEPHDKRVKRKDFLTFRPRTRGMVAIGNPPFGRNNALSVPFFNHAATMCDTIAFIVPKSWRKWSVTNRLDLSFACISDEELSINYVDVNGDDVYAKNNLQTCLQVWRRSETPRKRVRIAPSPWVSRSTPSEADIAMRVFGYGCGTIYTEFDRVPNTTMMFLKVHDPRALKALREADLSVYFNNVAYTQALAFSEICDVLNRYQTG